jgi:hypothetical protein
MISTNYITICVRHNERTLFWKPIWRVNLSALTFDKPHSKKTKGIVKKSNLLTRPLWCFSYDDSNSSNYLLIYRIFLFWCRWGCCCCSGCCCPATGGGACATSASRALCSCSHILCSYPMDNPCCCASLLAIAIASSPSDITVSSIYPMRIYEQRMKRVG